MSPLGNRRARQPTPTWNMFGELRTAATAGQRCFSGQPLRWMRTGALAHGDAGRRPGLGYREQTGSLSLAKSA